MAKTKRASNKKPATKRKATKARKGAKAKTKATKAIKRKAKSKKVIRYRIRGRFVSKETWQISRKLTAQAKREKKAAPLLLEKVVKPSKRRTVKQLQSLDFGTLPKPDLIKQVGEFYYSSFRFTGPLAEEMARQSLRILGNRANNNESDEGMSVRTVLSYRINGETHKISTKFTYPGAAASRKLNTLETNANGSTAEFFNAAELDADTITFDVIVLNRFNPIK